MLGLGSFQLFIYVPLSLLSSCNMGTASSWGGPVMGPVSPMAMLQAGVQEGNKEKQKQNRCSFAAVQPLLSSPLTESCSYTVARELGVDKWQQHRCRGRSPRCPHTPDIPQSHLA